MVRGVCRQHGITEQTFYRWGQKFSGMQVRDAARLRQLERENERLKKFVAERDLEIEFLKEVVTRKWSAHRSVESRFEKPAKKGSRPADRGCCWEVGRSKMNYEPILPARD